MVTETSDRKINTGAKIRNDGVKRLPHERDEAPEGQDLKPRGIMKQAAQDLEQGLVDTDLHGMRGVEQAVTPPAEPGQAKPVEDAAIDMRHQKPAAPPRDKQ